MPYHTPYDYAALNASDTMSTEYLKDAYIHGTMDTTFAATRASALRKVQRAREALRRADVAAARHREARIEAKDAEQAKRIAWISAIHNAQAPDTDQYQEHQYQGHHADGSGVQNHSAGGLYPYILTVRDARNDQGYEYGVLGGVLLDTLWVGSYDRAIALALYFKANAKGFTI